MLELAQTQPSGLNGQATAGAQRAGLAAGDLQMNHYGGRRLPFTCLGGSGLVQRFAATDGPERGEPFEVIDTSGGYGSACLGAGHPAVAAALARAVREVGYATDEVGSAERSLLLDELFGPHGRWAGTFPGDEYHVSGRNSGSEGLELALRLVLESRFDGRRLAAVPGKEGRDTILAFEGAWHGWTSGLTPFLNRRHYRVGLPGVDPAAAFGVRVVHIPYGEPTAMREFVARNGDRLLAVFVEPVQGDAGILEPPPGYLRELAGLTAAAGGLLVADEVLTFAKTGRWFAAADEQGPIPTDVTVIGKSLGMGVLSTSMVIARRSLSVRSSGAVSTSDLRPLTCAVIRDGLRHLDETGLMPAAGPKGEILRDLLRSELVERFPSEYREVRGRGFMQGVELTESAAGRLTRLRHHLIRAGVYTEFMAGAGRRSHGLRYVHPTMRIAPPLIAEADDLREIVRRLVAGTAAFLEEAQ